MYSFCFDLICRRQRGWRPQLHSINMQFGSSLKPTKDSVIRIKRFQKEDIKIYFLRKKGRGKVKNAKIIQSWVFCSPLMWVVVSEISSLHRSCRVHVKALVLPGSSSSPEILMSTSFTCCGVMCLTSLLSLVWPWSCELLTQRGEKCTGRVQRQTMNLTPQEKKSAIIGKLFLHPWQSHELLKPYIPNRQPCVSLCQAAKDAIQSLLLFVSVSN